MHPVCVVMLAALPLAVLAGSPQRVGLSAVIAATYMVAAVITSPGRRIDRVLVAYAGLVAGGVGPSWLRTTFLPGPRPGQLSYSDSENPHLVLIVLPMAAAGGPDGRAA